MTNDSPMSEQTLTTQQLFAIALASFEKLTSENATLTARCEALTAERDIMDKAHVNLCEDLANEKSRCQHLEQENEELKGRIANALL